MIKSLPDFLEQLKPCSLIWGPVAETAMCSPNLLPVPPVDTVGLHFPAALEVGHGHMTEFWSMECQKGHIHVLAGLPQICYKIFYSFYPSIYWPGAGHLVKESEAL